MQVGLEGYCAHIAAVVGAVVGVVVGAAALALSAVPRP
jgi:hypothetical protein